MRTKVVAILFWVTAFSALATFTYFNNFSALIEGMRSPPLAGLWLTVLIALLLSAPFILVAVVIWPIRALIVVSSAHAAIFFSLLTITSITFRPDKSLGGSLALLILTVLWLVLAVEFVMIFVALGRSREVELRAAFLPTFAGFAMPLIGGWALGVSDLVGNVADKGDRSRRTHGRLQPLLRGGRTASRSTAGEILWPGSMLAANRGGYSTNFHALMVIGSERERTYANWSYRLGGFVPVSDEARANIHLDREVEMRTFRPLLVETLRLSAFISDMTIISTITRDIEPAVLALNNKHAEELSWLEPERLSDLVSQAFYARRIGKLEAFLLAFDQDADYDSPNFLWFRARYPRFVYVDRIAVAASARGRGHARRLYEDLFDIAASQRPRHRRLRSELGPAEPGLRRVPCRARLLRGRSSDHPRWQEVGALLCPFARSGETLDSQSRT